jgi:hypothetical protein
MIRLALMMTLLTAAAVNAQTPQAPEWAAAPPAVEQPAPKPMKPFAPLLIAGPALALLGWWASIYQYFAVLDCYDTFPSCTGTSMWMLVPQAGPWMGLATGQTRGTNVFPAVALGIVQLLGLGLTLASAIVAAASS